MLFVCCYLEKYTYSREVYCFGFLGLRVFFFFLKIPKSLSVLFFSLGSAVSKRCLILLKPASFLLCFAWCWRLEKSTTLSFKAHSP